VYRKQVRRRRAVLVALIVVSLILISTSFSEADSGPLHSIQRGIATILSPLESVGERALKPARDLVNWFDETFDARGENDELREQVADLRSKLVETESELGNVQQLDKLQSLISDVPSLVDYEPVTARVIARPGTVWYSTVTVSEGSGAGVAVNDPVITGDGLVGRVREVTRNSAVVELITDHKSAVSGEVLEEGTQGIIEPELGDPDDLVFDYVEGQDTVQEGQILATAGWATTQISSAYPPGIPVGTVTETESAGVDATQRVHLRPFADLRGLEYVQVLTGGPERAGVPQ
jgi:rod shape-determining protein MreC